MLDILQLAISVVVLALVIAIHVDLRTPRGTERPRPRIRHDRRRHDALRLANL